MSTTPSDSFDFQNFYSTTLTDDIVAGDLTIPLSTAPTPSEGILVIDPDSTAPEVIFYTSKGASSVTCPADGRGWDSTTAASHTQGTTVIMAPTAYMLRMLKTGSLYDSYRTGWTTLGYAPNTVTANGNRSYDLVFSGNDLTGVCSPGMRLKLTRTVTAPTQCTDLEAGSSQYFNKTSPAGMTFTDDFVVSAWIKLESYGLGMIASRSNGTSGWDMFVNASGQLVMNGYNSGFANASTSTSYQSVPLNKWVHVAGQLDMSTFTATTTTSYFMIDGVDVPTAVSRTGTNPTALIQAGDLNIGARNGSVFFDGKIAQVAIYSAKVTQATIKASMNQTLSGSETNLVSAYSFNNSINDLSANANNLTAQGSAVATNADTPFTQDVTGTSVTAGTTNYAIITKASFSTNTTLTVQVPEGDTIPTSGGVSAVSYSTQKVPYGFPAQKSKWMILGLHMTADTTTSNASYGAFLSGGWQLVVPPGAWKVGYTIPGAYNATTTTIYFGFSPSALTGLTHAQGAAVYNSIVTRILSPSAAAVATTLSNSIEDAFSTTQTFIMYTLGSTTSAGADGSASTNVTFAECAYL